MARTGSIAALLQRAESHKPCRNATGDARWALLRAKGSLSAPSGSEKSIHASLLQTFRAFARNNAWSSHRLLSSCKRLSPAEFVAPRSGFFPSLQATLDHILVIDWFYVDALEGGRLGPKAWENEVPCPGIESLISAQACVDRRLILQCDALTEAALNTHVHVQRSAGVQSDRRDRLLMHLCQH